MYGRADANGNPEIKTYTVNGHTADIVSDPATGTPVLLATPSGVNGLYGYDPAGDPGGIVVNDPASFGLTYDPYGVETVNYDGGGDGSGSNPYAFKGGTVSQAVGLVKFGLRWYDPSTGGWLQEDTLDTPLDPSNANRYAYAADDPVNGADITGQRTAYCTITEGTALVATGVAAGALVYAAFTAPADAVPVAGQANEAGAITTAAVAGAPLASCSVRRRSLEGSEE